jgi:VWFA-related protein
MDARPLEPASESKKVTIVATVTDRDHHLVSGLSSGDFEVQDDGHACASIAFDASRWPLSVTVLLDRSDSLSIGPKGVRTAAARFVTDLLPNEEARLCAFAGYVVCSPRFTTDHDELAQEVRHSPSGFGTHLFDALWLALDGMDMTPVGRRQVIVVFSDGEDNGSRTLFSHLMDRLRARDVMVYGIGLQTQFFDDGDGIVESRPNRTLMPLAMETGGNYDEPGNHRELERVVTRIEEELRHQYVLMFTPTSNADVNHRIHVLATRTNLRVRTRRRLPTPKDDR